MNRMTFKDSVTGKNYTRISKKAAQKSYINGITVVLCPCNMQPFGMWSRGYFLNKEAWKEFYTDGIEDDFNGVVNAFEYYNCNAQLGYYTSFYVEEK